MIEATNFNVHTKDYKFLNEVFGKKSFRHKVSNYLDFFDVAEKGLKRKLIWNFMDYFNISPDTMAELLNTSPKTVYSWKKSTSNFNKEDAIQLLALSELFQYGIKVFEDKANFFEWLDESNKSIGGLRPISILFAPYGIERVKDMLGRIEYGIFA